MYDPAVLEARLPAGTAPDGETATAFRIIPGSGDPSTAVNAAAFSTTLPQDTLFDGKLYVSNRHDPFEDEDEDNGSVEGGYNTVLVTMQGDADADCLSVTVKNGSRSITLTLVETVTVTGDGDAPAEGNAYFQNYFRVADADLDLPDSLGADAARNSDGRYSCTDGVLAEVDTDR